MPGKTKVSVSVEASLLKEVDRVAGKMSRSAVFEQALASWVRQRRQRELDHAIEHYYRSLSLAERAEDDRWAALGDDTATRGWDEPKR
jgi:metal-responsive CopG/Arc/MetJ family transcriptional regulator